MVGGGSDAVRARFHWRITAFYFWTNCPSSTAKFWRFCANRWKTAKSTFPARRASRLSRQIPACRCHEPVSVRLSRASCQTLPLHARKCRALPKQNFRSAARPHRFDHRSPQPVRRRTDAAGSGRKQCVRFGTRHRRRGKQYARQGKVNAALSVSELDSQACIQKEAQEALGSLLEKLSLSARSFHRIMRVARTLADLAGDEEVGRSHVMKAIGFRRAL